MAEKYQIVVSPEARDDLKRELDYIRRKWSVQRAKLVRDGISKVIAQLDTFPDAHPKLHRICTEERTYRFVPKWAYLIVFRIEIEKSQVRVVSIFSSDQEPKNADKIKAR